MTSLFQSFMDAVIPPPRKIPEGQKPETTATSGGSWPEESREPGRAGSRTALERRVRGDPQDTPQDDLEVEVEDLGSDSEEDEWGQRNPLDPGDLASQITVRRPRPTHTPQPQDQSGLEDSEAPQPSGEEESQSGLHTGIYLKTPSSIRMWLLSYKPLTKHWKEGLLNKHIWWRRPLELYTLQSLRHLGGSKRCSNCKRTVKLTSNRLLVKRSMNTESSLQPPNRNSSLRTVNTNKRFINCKTRFAP